ncbi:MAG: OmpA family protein, partial [Proteobacteria bacterium]
MPGWDVGISLPHILSQSVEDQAGARGEFAATGGTEIRVNTKVRLFGDDSGGVALVASANFSRIQDNPYAGDGAGPTFNFEAAADTTIGKIALGGNVGYRLRSPGDKIPNSIGNPLGDQIIASAAASYLVADWSTKFIGEIYTSFAAQTSEDENDNRSLSSAELLLGAKHDINTNLALHAGFGTELAQGLASPDYRVYTGLNYTFGPVFKQPIASSKPEPTSKTRTTVVEEADEELIQQLATEQTADGPVERFRTQAILFEFDSDKMVGNYARVLAELAKYLKGGFRELIVEGHTDSIGSEAYNDKLSLRRAAAIKRYLVQKYGFT